MRERERRSVKVVDRHFLSLVRWYDTAGIMHIWTCIYNLDRPVQSRTSSLLYLIILCHLLDAAMPACLHEHYPTTEEYYILTRLDHDHLRCCIALLRD